jgi:hypothetical protein
MPKKASTKDRNTAYRADELALTLKKSLEIKQIRSYVDRLMALPDGAPMPDWSELSIGDRFEIALRLVPADQREELLGKSAEHVRRYSRGVDIPLTVVAALAAETEIPLDWIVTGRAMMRLAPVVYVTPTQPRGDTDDIALQKLAFRPSAGHGTPAIDDSAEYVRFPRAILDHLGVKPQHARLMEATGLSMYPTIDDRDLMLVSIGNTDIVEGKVYVFSVGDEVFVKRLRRAGGRVMMMSDNRDLFPNDEPVPESVPFRVHARVEWAGRKI